MAIMKNTLKNLNNNLFMDTIDTELSKFCREVFLLGEKFPGIYKMIKADQDARGKLKKHLRTLDKEYIRNKTSDLPGFTSDIGNISGLNLNLETGRPRMKPELVLLFTCLRGYYGSVTDREVSDRFKDSMTLYVLLSNLNIKMPAPTTILENINSLSNETRDLIMQCQLEDIMDASLDDFKYVLFDSTSVAASSTWPTDAGIILRLLERVYIYGQKLEDFGLKSIQEFYFKSWFKELKELLFKINNTRGTKKCTKKKKLQKLYSDYLKSAHKAYEYLVRIFESRSTQIAQIDMRPTLKLQLKQIHDNIEDDLLALSSVLYYAEERIFNDITLPSPEKILSLSDTTAAFIKKGQRNPVIGYKPQISQSKHGFVTALLLKKGNIADSDCLYPLAQLHSENTGVVPEFISADDGYSSKAGREACLGFGVKDVCLSGSVGRKITPEDLWESEVYLLGRKKRSAIESLMFTLKYVFEFGRLRRRGLENAKAEMTEEVIAYNIRKKILLQERLTREKEILLYKKSA
jgi:hypothetical protein